MGSVSYIGAHRSKGMDFLAVILIDFASFEEPSADSKHVDFQEAYFMGASRARQLLGVVSVNVWISTGNLDNSLKNNPNIS